MIATPLAADTLLVEPLRSLTLEAARHPRGLAHLSAASGLVCANGRVYVAGDDEHHLAVFRDLLSPGELVRILPGDLPRSATARKRRKPDLEALLMLPGGALVAFGSGSRPNRGAGVYIALDAQGEPLPEAVRRFDLKPLYEPLRAVFGEINIEGAMCIGAELVLLNRAVAGRSPNAALHYPLEALLGAIDGASATVAPRLVRSHELGDIDGVALGFTDGAALPGGGWVFCAAAENTADSYLDGPCTGAAVGVVDARGETVSLHRLATTTGAVIKVEGIAARPGASGIDLCLVTDADDPAQSAQLLRARL